LHQGKRWEGKIRLDFFASFFVKKKRRERKVSGKRWEAASREKVREKRILKKIA
jgi:hypothetical protein